MCPRERDPFPLGQDRPRGERLLVELKLLGWGEAGWYHQDHGTRPRCQGGLPAGGQRWTHMLGYTTPPAAHPGPSPSPAGAAAAWHCCQGSLSLQPPAPVPPCAPSPRLYPPAASEGTSDPGVGEKNTPNPNPVPQ